jgi:hypothetical protein
MARTFVAIVAIVCGLGLSGAWASADAQECGDADGSGTVGVSDGVQTLRAAAGLDSLCTAAVCDVDGSGAITVTDGVSVLRKAAGLAITENCSGGSAGQPATILAELQTLLKVGVAFATGTPVTVCENSPDGEIDVDTDVDGTTTSFFGCQFQGVGLTGDVTVGTTLLTFSFFEADTAGEEDFIADYDGELTLGSAGGGRSLDGAVDVTTESAGTVTMTFAGATVVAGKLTGGSATVDLTDSDIADSFTSLVLTFDGSDVANVTGTQSNGGTTTFRFNIATGTVS